MVYQTSQEEISYESDDSNEATCNILNRYPEQGTDSVDHADIHYCSIHSNDVATVQCIECVKNGLPVKYSYYCSSKCLLDSWKNHYLHHHNEIIRDSCYENRFDYWRPGETFEIQSLNWPSRSRYWIPASLINTEITEMVSEVGTITVLSYNMLSQIYAYGLRYSHCPEEYLEWNYRRENLLYELLHYNADVLCLQEVQLEYGMPACSLMENLDSSLRKQAEARLVKDNVALAVILEVVGNSGYSAESVAFSSNFCVVNTHICASWRFPDVKLLQVSNLVNQIEMIIDPTMPVFICGDMNSYPGSDPYVLLTEGAVDVAYAQAPDPLRIFQYLKLHHSMLLASAYSVVEAEPFTSLDYIFYTGKVVWLISKLLDSANLPFTSLIQWIDEDSVEVDGVLDFPVLESVDTGRKALPSKWWSSDHIALLGRFRITRPYYGYIAPFHGEYI